MRNMIRLVAIGMCLVLALSAGVGCSKKNVSGTPELSAEEQARREAEARRQAELEAMRQRELSAQQGMKGGAQVKNALTEMIFFGYDSSEITPASRDILQQKAAALKAQPNIRLTVEGHCDERGTPEYNMALGQRRAKAAMEYLSLSGVSASRMNAVSYGEERPLVQGSNEAAYAKNRRAEFKPN